MRVNVGLPGPVSVGGDAPQGCGVLVVLAFVMPVLCCFGWAIMKYAVENF
jgi:hypothetical protein